MQVAEDVVCVGRRCIEVEESYISSWLSRFGKWLEEEREKWLLLCCRMERSRKLEVEVKVEVRS